MKTEDVLAYENEQRFVREAFACYRAEAVIDPAPPAGVSSPMPEPDSAAPIPDAFPPPA